MTEYTKGKHTVSHHRYHISWITKYRYKVLTKDIQVRVKAIIHQVAKEMGVAIETGVLSSDHLHLFVAIPPHIAVSDFVQKAKGRSSRKIQLEFPELGKTYWGKHFWARGYFSATSGGITDEAVTHYINNHSESRHPTPPLTQDKKIN